MVTSVNDPDIDNYYPGAAKDGYELTSPITSDYNCIAWAASITNINWWPDPAPGWDWPAGVPNELSLPAFIQAFETMRYEICGQDASLQQGYEKITIYVDQDGLPTHAARQLSDGIWTSKIGGMRDIHHTSPRAVEDVPGEPRRISDYGNVAVYMRRKRRPGDVCLRSPGVPDLALPYEEAFVLTIMRRILRNVRKLLQRR